MEYKCGTRVTMQQCAKIKDRVNLGTKSGDYCRMCYPNPKQVTNSLTWKERKKRCRTSALGCPIYKEPVCNECWKKGYDKHV